MLQNIYVYDDGVIRGVVCLEGTEIKKLYVDTFFQGRGIGGKLLEFALEKKGSSFLWALEKNEGAIRFYESHGFRMTGEKIYEEGTTEYMVKMEYMRPNIIIREVAPGDAHTLAYVQTESWKKEFCGILPQAELERCTQLSKAEAMYERLLEEKKGHGFLLLLDNNPHCIAYWDRSRVADLPDYAELICIHSLQDNWGKGYGSMMMEYVLAEIQKAGYKQVMLWVFEKNYRACRFYEKHGFVMTDRAKKIGEVVEVMYQKVL